MKGTQCLNNSRAALYRVFVSPLEASVFSNAPRISLMLSSQHIQPLRQTVPAQLPLRLSLSRGLATTGALSATPHGRQRAVPDRLPIDFEIRANEVMLVEDDNKITGPHKTQRLLATLDVTTYSLRTIENPLPPPKPSDDGKPERPRRPGSQFPLCRIVHKADEYKREQARSKAKKEAAKATKQKGVEINWAIAQNDLSLKLRQLRSFLEKGHKVGVTFARKKGARTASGAEMEAVIKAVRDLAAEVPGAREWKAADGDIGRKYFMYYEGKVIPPPSSS